MAMAAERMQPAADDNDGGDEEELFTRPRGAPEKKADPDEAPITAKERREFRQQIKNLEAQAAERAREADYWAGRARNQPAPREAAPPKPAEPDLDDVTAMEEFTKSPLTAFEKMAKKHGYVTKAEQEANINAALDTFGKAIMARISTDRDLLRDFPDLADSKSTFAKRTMEILEDLTEGDGRKRNAFFRAAAKQAQLEGELAGKRARRPRAAADDEEDIDDGDLNLAGDEDVDDDETPAERRSRIARQGPRGGGGRSARALDTGSDVMDRVFEAFDIAPERRAAVAKKVKIAKRNAITEGM